MGYFNIDALKDQPVDDAIHRKLAWRSGWGLRILSSRIQDGHKPNGVAGPWMRALSWASATISSVRHTFRLLALGCSVALAACGASGATGSGSAPRATATTAVDAAKVRLVQVGRFRQPVGVTGAPGDPSRVFVVQRAGQVMLMLNGHTRARPFLDIGNLVHSQGGDEQGLLGLAFPPDYARSGLFYVDYTIADNDIRIAQYRRSPGNDNLANPASARVVLTIDHHRYTNHNGGQLAFGPEGELYIGVGDGGSEDDPEDNGQNTDTLLGKILRIDPSAAGGYTIPPTNPFVGEPSKRGEIWAYGLRNPWRFSFDRLTGDLIVGDVGQDLQEEVDFVPARTGAGANYGWSVWEGNRRNKPGNAPHAVFPVLVARHSDGYCAIIGGYVVRDRSLPSLYGRYLFGDYCRPQIESVELSRANATGLHATGMAVSETSSFGEDARGHIYITSLSGPVYRITSG
jgi:glucose/arabinose dehydrogenase